MTNLVPYELPDESKQSQGNKHVQGVYNVDPTTGLAVSPGGGGGGGGGGAVTVVDGGDITQGSTTDTAVTGDTTGTQSAKLRGLNKIFADIWDSVNHAFKAVQVGTWTVQPGNTANTTAWKVDGSAVTQPVKGAGTAGTPDASVVSVQGVSGGTAAPISAASLPLPSGAATSAKQPALGTAGTPAADVISIQGVASGTVIPVSQGAATPTSATLQNAQAGNANGTPLNTSGMSSAVLTVNMSGFTGTVNFEGQEDGANFKALTAVQIGTRNLPQTAVGSTTTSLALYEIPVAGLQQIQARTSGVSAGTVTVTGHAVPVAYNGKTINANTAGTDASGTASTTNPNQTGGIAATSFPTKVANGQVVTDMNDAAGRKVVVPGAPREFVGWITRLTLTSTTTETTLIAAAANIFADVTWMVCVNTSATACVLDFRDSTGGTIRVTHIVPPTDERGMVLSIPGPQAGANTNWTVQCATSVASIIITGGFLNNK